MRWSHYREIIQKKSGGAAYDDLETPPLKPNQLLVADHISVENETTAYTNLRIGPSEGGILTPFEEEKNPAAANVYWTRSELRFIEHERVCCRLTGCTSGDIIKATVQGKLYQLE